MRPAARLLAKWAHGLERRLAWWIAPVWARLTPRRDWVAIVPQEDQGSLGDQAMLESLIDLLSNKARLCYFPHTYAGWPLERNGVKRGPRVGSSLFDLTALRWLCRASDLYVIGADVVDGAYSDRRIEAFTRICNLAVRCGTRAQIVSFSMNKTPSVGAKQMWARLHDNVKLFARDPESCDRVEEYFHRKAHLAPDLAFLGSAAPEDVRTPSLPRLVGIVPNANRLFLESFADSATYVKNVTNLVQLLTGEDTGLGVVLIPHDSRGVPSDYDLCDEIAARVDSPQVIAATQLTSFRQVRSVLRKLDLVLACRMHAAIGALGEGTVPIVLEYQDKATGMMELFGLEELILRPDALHNPEEMKSFITRALENVEQHRSNIKRHLPGVRASAARVVDQGSTG